MITGVAQSVTTIREDMQAFSAVLVLSENRLQKSATLRDQVTNISDFLRILLIQPSHCFYNFSNFLHKFAESFLYYVYRILGNTHCFQCYKMLCGYITSLISVKLAKSRFTSPEMPFKNGTWQNNRAVLLV